LKKKFKLNFLENSSINFSEILRTCSWCCPLPIKGVSRNSIEGKKVTTLSKIPKIVKIRNSRPEVDIDERSTVFFTVRHPLADAIKTFRQGALQVVETEKVPRPQNFQNPNFST